MTNRKPIEFVTKGIPKFSEIDPYGHVNTTHFVNYFLEHRFTGMRETLGWDLKTVSRLPALFIMRKIEIEFLRPLLAEEFFEIRSHVSEFKERTCEVICSLSKTAADGTTVVSATAKMTLVCVDRRSGASTAWPTEIIEKFFEPEV